MRFGFSVWALAVLPTIASTFVLPAPVVRPAEAEGTQGDTFLELDPRNAKAIFSVPCTGCGLGQPADDESTLTFEFQAFLSEHPCGASNTTLNGQHLAQNWDGINAHGQGAIPSLIRQTQLDLSPPLNLDLHLSWQTSCLFNGLPTEQAFSLGEDVAQLLTVTVNRIGDRELPGTHGFTISYKPFIQPELLRLSPIPVPEANQSDASEDWRNPPLRLRIDSPASDEELSLQNHIDELRRLEREADLIHERIREQKKKIKTHFGHDDHHSLTEEIDRCETFTCVLSAIARKTRGAIRFVYMKLISDPHPPPPHGHSFDKMARPDVSRFAHRPGGQAAPFSVPPPPADYYPDEKHPTVLLSQAEPPRRHPQPSPLVLAFEILAGVLGLSGLFALLRRLCSPRRRAERKAAREERNRAREYHRSARRQRFHNWFTSRRARAERDCEEKAALVSHQEDTLEAAMQEEIRALGIAHEVVESLVQEARVSASYSRAQQPRNSPLPLARVDSLPDYGSDSGMSEPPEYQTDDDDSDVVVDGFREYTPSTTSVWTPGSSIPDVSPRESGETIRSIYMRV